MDDVDTERRPNEGVEYEVGSTVQKASKYAPYGALPAGSILAGTLSLLVENWGPFLFFLIPFLIYWVVHHSTSDRFLGDAAWAVAMNMIGFTLAFTYPAAIAVFTAIHSLLPNTPAWTTTVVVLFGTYQYASYYYHQKQEAWNEMRTSNLRFAINRKTRTFRFNDGFNFGTVDSLGWDDFVIGVLLSISSTGAAFLGGLVYEPTHQTPLVVMGGIGLPVFLAFIRFELISSLVTIQRIREYEREHNVQIRPR
jgi:hypothetical protein